MECAARIHYVCIYIYYKVIVLLRVQKFVQTTYSVPMAKIVMNIEL